LETIDYKFQLLDITTKFRAHKKAGYVKFLADLSIAEIRDFSIWIIRTTLTPLRPAGISADFL